MLISLKEPFNLHPSKYFFIIVTAKLKMIITQDLNNISTEWLSSASKRYKLNDCTKKKTLRPRFHENVYTCYQKAVSEYKCMYRNFLWNNRKINTCYLCDIILQLQIISAELKSGKIQFSVIWKLCKSWIITIIEIQRYWKKA